eukprot:11179765-Lingulodinium_polyedra.AAC.1
MVTELGPEKGRRPEGGEAATRKRQTRRSRSRGGPKAPGPKVAERCLPLQGQSGRETTGCGSYATGEA